VCDVEVVDAASDIVVVEVVTPPPVCPEPGRTAATPLLTVIAEAAASRTVVELTVLNTPAEVRRPDPEAVTTVVFAVAVVSVNLKYATPSTKFELSSVSDVAYVPVAPLL
jgi:hypothetical protein